jgi:hypothetical protein
MGIEKIVRGRGRKEEESRREKDERREGGRAEGREG